MRQFPLSSQVLYEIIIARQGSVESQLPTTIPNWAKGMNSWTCEAVLRFTTIFPVRNLQIPDLANKDEIRHLW